MNRLTPSLLLSTLLIGTGYGADWTIDKAETKTINNKTINGVDLTKQGNLTVNSQGTSEIKDMRMYFLNTGAGATFNVQNGSLNLDLSLANAQGVRNHVAFNVQNGSTLTLTHGQNGKPLGIFQGNSTNLTANITNNSTLKGHLSNNGTTKIEITGKSKMEGNISQNGGTIDATIEGKLTGNIILNKHTTKAQLWANRNTNVAKGTTTITGNIIHQAEDLSGVMKGLELQGSFTQSGGKSDIAFHSSEFKNTTTLSGGESLLHFYDTTLKSITSTGGTNTINLKGVQGTGANGSHMQDYTGIGSRTNINLIESSSMKSASQTQGSLSINSQNSKIDGSITGDRATLNITLSKSELTGGISNSQGSTTITSSDSTIGGNVTQNGGKLHAVLTNTKLNGSFTQIKGEFSKLIANNSTIDQGIFLQKVSNNNPVEDMVLTNTTINNGLTMDHLLTTFKATMINTTINGGYKQTNGEKVIINGTGTKINGGIQVSDGNRTDYMTIIELNQNSSIKGGIVANNHSIKVSLANQSTSEDRITITGGKGYFKAVGTSSFTGDLTSQNTTETQLHLEQNSKLIGNVSQIGGNQQINLQGGSLITGSITNTGNVNSITSLQTQSQLQGNLTQTGGSLNLGIGGNSTIMGNVELNNVQTTLNNGRTTIPQATIKGNLTQNGGSLTGRIGGLTLQGVFTQNGGTSNITFQNATFLKPTSINQAILSKVYFDNNSNLKDYTITDSNNPQNLLSLNNRTTLNGNFTLKNSSSILTIRNDSKITGSVISKDAGNKLQIDIQSGGSIEGNLEIEKGEISGTINSGTIGGDLKLTDATSNLKFSSSKINGNIHIIRGTNEISLSGTEVGGWFKMEGNGPNDPTLKLKISNKSSIGGDLSFINTKAFLGGMGVENVIKGNLISKNSTLSNGIVGGWHSTISGLTIQQELQQEKGSLDLIMENKSNIQGNTTIQTPDKFHLTLKNQSSMQNFKIEGGTDNELIFIDQSSQNGGMTLTDTKITLKALQNSSIAGNINVVSNNNFASETKIYLNQSSLTGNISQSSGSLLLDYANQSKMTGSLLLNNLNPAQITLDNSQIIGAITATQSKVNINMSNNSLINTDLNSTNSEITLNANNSTLSGNIQHTGNFQAQDFELKFHFTNGAKFENIKTNLAGSMKIEANGSIINSEEINLILGKLNITMDNSSGVIKDLKTGGNNQISIVTSNASDSSITKLEIKDSANLSLIANTEAIISGELFVKNKATAFIQSLENALVKFDLSLQDQANLDIALSGGKLQGKITQNGISLGNATLGSAGQFGGRWIMTESSNLNTLTINNSDANVNDRALMLMGVENSQISMVDMTKDPLGASRIGLAITNGNPQNNQTTARMLSLSRLNGQNGVFRVYTDLGSGLSDKVTTATATGSHIIQVYYNPATFTHDLTGKHIVVAHVDDAQTTANFIGGLTEVGNQAYQTDLLKVTAGGGNGFDWILGNAQQAGPSYGTKVIASILQSQYRSFGIQTETLNQRLGELKNINRISGLWARYFLGNNQTRETQTHIKVQDNFYSTWIGYDQNSISLRGQNFFGFALSHTLVSPESKDYTGSIHNIGFNFYNVFLAKNDFYFDIVAKYILSHGSYDISYVSLSKNSPKYLNHKLMVSLEIGKKFKFQEQENGFFYIQPEGQITSGYIHGNDLTFIDLSNTAIDANLSYTFPVIMRAGLVGAYAMEYSSFKADFRFGTSFVYEVKTGGDVRLDDGNSIVKYKYTGDLHLLFQLGTNIIINDSSRIYLEGSTGFLGITSTTYAFNAGVRFTFGPKNTRKLKIPTASNPPPPPKPEYDPRNIPVITDNTKQDIKNNKQYESPPRYSSDYFINTRRNFRDPTSLKR